MRARILAFSCFLFGHVLEVTRVDADAIYCECGKRYRTGTEYARWPGEFRKHLWNVE
jgi:hypothetical protein